MAALALSSLPLGFRFHPTDEELVNHYLRSKINNKDSDVEVIPEVDVCKCEPWDLPDKSLIKTDDPEWFFFCPRDRKYPNGSRSNRATEAGYWKATGKDRTIKSRAFGMKSIGTKKTLVFYRGRAPKGERTNWVMHEYRATEKELDGTNDGQSAYVLCRLFRKPDGKTDNSNYDEIEPTGSSPTTTKSSPDGIPLALALVQPTPELDMQVGKQPAGIERWLADRDDHEPEGTSTKVDPQRLFYEPTTEPVDCKVFSPLQSEMCTGLELSFMDSAFANDFGRNHIGLVFQDGTSEQDISISEFFDAGVNNQDEYSCEESTSQKNSAVESEIPTGVGIRQPQYMLSASGWGPVFGKDSGSSSDTDTEVQAQYYPKMEASRCFNEHGDSEDLPTAQGSFGAGATLYVGEYGGGNIGLFQDDSFGLDASSVDFPYRDLFNSLEESTSQTNPVVNAGGLVGTGIKLRAREPQYQSSAHDFATQGTAPRRVRLQEKLSSAEDHEVKPKVIEVEDSAEHTATDEPQEETALIYSGIAEEFNKSLRLRSRCEGVVVGDRQGSTISPEMPPVRCHRRPNLSYVYIVSVAVLTIMFMVFIWAWRCLKS